MNPILIIGSGMAGYTLAREIRQLDPEREILLLCGDGGASYAKPSLSNALTQGKTPEALLSASAEQMEQKLGIRVHPGTVVTSINRSRQFVQTSAGQFPYGQLVLATGADPVRLALEGDGAREVLSVNDLEDYARFRKNLPQGGKVFVLGAGLIGCEFANDLVGNGFGVALADPAPHPLASLVPAKAGKALQKGLQRAGVEWHLGQGVREVCRLSHGGFEVRLDSGQKVSADLVLSAVGLRPRTTLAAEAGLAVERGIVVDQYLRTSDSSIFALGDCAQVRGRWLPFVQPLLLGARALARSLCGQETAVEYPPMPVMVKTPACPLVVLPPSPAESGVWETQESPEGLTLRFLDEKGVLKGFVLTGQRTKERVTFLKSVGSTVFAVHP